MKFAIVLALLGAALAASSSHHQRRFSNSERNIQESSFRSGREYKYEFNGQLSAGLPISSTPQGITRLQSLVTLQMVNDRTARMQLNDIKFATSQEEQNARNMQPFDRFESVNMIKEHEELLSMPFEFTYKHGIVSEMRFNQEDQPWSENIKRAVVNMLQVNVLKKDRVEANEKYDRVESSENVNSFVTVEKTLEGECEVFYTLEDNVNQQQDEQNWSKSINFEKCTRRPTIQNVQTPVCKECKPTIGQETMSSTVMNFNITGTPEQFLINSVELRSQHMFVPISQKHQLLSAFTINTLELVYAGEQKKSIEKISGEETTDLVYNQQWELAEQKWAQTGEEKYLRQLPQWADNKVEIVQKMFALMAKQFEQNPTEIELEIAHTVSRIVKVMRLCNEQEIRKIKTQVYELIEKEHKHGEQIRSIFGNTLTLAATRVTIAQYFNLVDQDPTFDPIQVSLALKTLVHMRYPSIQIAEDVAKFCENSGKPMIRQSCWLAYGSIVNGVCSPTPRVFVEDRTKMCPRDAKKRMVEKLISQFESSDDLYEQILALKTIANAGLDLSIYPLEKIILNEKYDTTIRTQAVEALRRLRHTMPTKVQQVLLPIYKNRQQPQHLRMSALYQLVATQPEWPVLSQIVQQLRQERNQQVRAFTLTLLRSFANNESPCEETFAVRVKSLLQVLPFNSQEIDTFESRYGKWSVYYNKIQSGFDANVATLFTNESILPTEMMTSFDGLFAGEWDQYFAQVGFTQKNVEKTLKSLLSTVQEKGMENVLVRGKRSSDSFRPTQFLNRLLEKLPFVHREHNSQEPHALFYIRHRDMDYAFLPIDAASLPEIVKNMVEAGRIELAEIEQYLTKGLHFSHTSAAFFYESVRRIPTPLGLPVELTSKMPTVASINGQIKAELEPKNGRSFEGVRLHLVAKPRVASTHVLSLTVVSPFAQVGTKFLHQLVWNTPVDAKLEINWENKFVVKTSFKAPTEERRVFLIQSRPVTFTRTITPEIRQYPEPIEMTWMLPSQQLISQPIDRKYFKDIQVKVQGTWNRPTSRQIPTWVVDNTMEVFFTPSSSAPEQYESILEVELYENAKMEKNMDKHFKSSKRSQKYLEEDEEYDQEEQNQEIQKNFNWLENEKVYKHSVNFEVKPNVFKMNMNAICNENFHFCKSTIRSEDIDSQVSIHYVFPMMPKSFEELKEQKFRNLVVVGEATIQDKKVELKIQGEQSQEQKQWIKEVRAQSTQVSQQELLREASRLDQYQVVVNWDSQWEKQEKNLNIYPMSIQRFWNIAQTYLRIQYPFSSQVQSFDEIESKRSTDDNTIRAKFTIEPRQRQTVNMTIETPMERFTLNRVEMPFALPTVQIHYQPKNKRFENKPLLEKIVRQATNQAECVVKSTKIQTFDDVKYTNQFTPCYSVLAKDCGAENKKNPRFVVLMKKINNKKDEAKNVRVLYRNNEIELEMNSQKQMIVRVNGEEKEYEKETMEIAEKHYNLVWLNKHTVRFDSDEVTVQFDGVNANIHVSSLYQNQQCGLCGHYDNEQETEFYSADNKENTIQEFAKSYLYKDDECSFDEEIFNKRENFRRLNANEENDEENYDNTESNQDQDQETPRKQIVVLEKQHQICFSRDPVARCEKNNSVESRKEKIGFYCVPSSDSSARRLMREIRREPLAQWPEHKLRQVREVSDMEEREWRVKVDEKCEL